MLKVWIKTHIIKNERNHSNTQSSTRATQTQVSWRHMKGPTQEIKHSNAQSVNKSPKKPPNFSNGIKRSNSHYRISSDVEELKLYCMQSFEAYVFKLVLKAQNLTVPSFKQINYNGLLCNEDNSKCLLRVESSQVFSYNFITYGNVTNKMFLWHLICNNDRYKQ